MTTSPTPTVEGVTATIIDRLAEHPEARPAVLRRLATAARHAERIDDPAPLLEVVRQEARDADQHRHVWVQIAVEFRLGAPSPGTVAS